MRRLQKIAVATVVLALAALALEATRGANGATSQVPVRAMQEPIARVGAPAPLFTTVDTRSHAQNLADYRGRWVVLEWFSSACPYTRKHYAADNMQAMQRDYTARGVAWLSIVSSAPGKEGYTTPAALWQWETRQRSAQTAVIRDTTGVLGHRYGARNTPQLFVIDPRGVLRYAGAVDDKPTTRLADVRTATNYVRAALDASLTGKPIAIAQTQPYGCAVQY